MNGDKPFGVDNKAESKFKTGIIVNARWKHVGHPAYSTDMRVLGLSPDPDRPGWVDCVWRNDVVYNDKPFGASYRPGLFHLLTTPTVRSNCTDCGTKYYESLMRGMQPACGCQRCTECGTEYHRKLLADKPQRTCSCG